MEMENGKGAKFPWEIGLAGLGGEGALTWEVIANPRGCCKTKTPMAACCRAAPQTLLRFQGDKTRLRTSYI